MQDDFPEYTLEGKLGLAVLNSYWAHAVFYCEDEAHEAFYERVIRRLIPKCKDFLVVCLGGKSEVIRAAQAEDHEPSVPPIFIVDKDFDDLLNLTSTPIRLGIIYLRKYSIENYLTQQEAFIQIALEETVSKGIVRRQLLEKLCDYHVFEEQLRVQLLHITKLFAIARKYHARIQTTKTPCSMLYAHSEITWPLPDQEWIDKFVVDLKASFPSASEWVADEPQFSNELSSSLVAEQAPWGVLPDDFHIVGKHYLGGLIRFVDNRLETNMCAMSDPTLYMRIAQHIDLSQIEYLKEEILARVPGLVVSSISGSRPPSISSAANLAANSQGLDARVGLSVPSVRRAGGSGGKRRRSPAKGAVARQE